MSYLTFLQKLLALGDKLPAIFAAVQKIIADVQALIALVSPAPVADTGLQFTAVGADEETAELAVAKAIGGDTGLFDLSALRAVFQFLRDNPALLELVKLLLGGK